MEQGYWIAEYGKVFAGYLFLMFIWPSVVFGTYLRKKQTAYRFSFCVTIQIVLVNVIVLTLGLFHILDQRFVAVLFYGVFLIALAAKAFRRSVSVKHWHPVTARSILWGIRRYVKEKLWVVYPRLGEYGALAAVLLFGMMYFSYGAFQVHSYGFGDLYVHHEWIYGLKQGKIFSGGVYPEAMHCFIYCMEALFGIRVYNILLFLQCIHVTVFLVSAYLLLREVFHWKYTPIFVLTVFLTLDLVNADQIYSMFRLQITLPQEFGMHTQFLCALYLIRYLKYSHFIDRKGRKSQFCWDENLLVFMLALSASVATHFYTVIMAFVMCFSFVIFSVRKLFTKVRFVPLACAVFCGCFVAALPMAGALASGLPFNYSIDWAIQSMDGGETEKLEKSQEDDAGVEKSQEGIGENSVKQPKEAIKGNGNLTEAGKAPGQEQPSGNGKEEGRDTETGWMKMIQKKITICLDRVKEFYENSFFALYGKNRSGWILSAAVCILLLYLISGWRGWQWLREACRNYLPLIVFMFVFMLIYAAPYIGLPSVISDSRFCMAGHLMTLAVVLAPADILFSIPAFSDRKTALQILSLLSVAGIYALVVLSGSYHGFLFYELTRYNEVVDVTNSIIASFDKGSFVLVAPTDELYPAIDYGWHEETLEFIEKSGNKDYTIDAEHIFIYVEKKPLLYAQAYFFEGPSWIAKEKYMDIYWDKYSEKYPDSGASQAPHIKASEVSETAAEKEIPEIWNRWFLYTRLENRTILESKIYHWCQQFLEQHPADMDIYYEDDNFVCYEIRQESGKRYNLGIE